MSEQTAISWCDSTFSPWRGCAKVSHGCEHCYASALAARFPQHGTWGTAAQGGRRVIAADASWQRVRAWDKKAERDGVRRTVFPSMCDPFEEFDGRVDLGPCMSGSLDDVRARLWDLIAETPNIVWLLLTKRPQNAPRMVPSAWARGWPRNAWIGTTVEDQRRADERMPHLLRIPARRFLSVEPQLESVDLTRWLSTHRECDGCTPDAALCSGHRTANVYWLIAGGESGPHARPYDLAWPRALRYQCNDAGVPFFFKQAGDNTVNTTTCGRCGGRGALVLHREPVEDACGDCRGTGRITSRVPLLRAKSPLDELPADLRVREVPTW